MSAADKDRIAQDVESLVEIFNRSEWQEMHLKTDEVEIFLSNDPNASRASVVSADIQQAAPAVLATEQALPQSQTDAGIQATDTPSSAKIDVPDGMVAVTAPNLGTFYRAPKPGAAPYVEAEQSVSSDSDVCLIEVMKLFTPVKAGVNGKVHAICVEDGTMVEFGDVLVIIDPS